jgi:hypothetical protein
MGSKLIATATIKNPGILGYSFASAELTFSLAATQPLKLSQGAMALCSQTLSLPNSASQIQQIFLSLSEIAEGFFE